MVTPSQQPFVFISYSRKDRYLALQVAQVLHDEGVQFFLDTRDILPGQHWDRTIDTNLRAASHLLLIHTMNSFESDNVWDEWSFVMSKPRKAVIPLIFDANADLPYRLHRVQNINFTKLSTDAAFEELLTLLLNAHNQMQFAHVR